MRMQEVIAILAGVAEVHEGPLPRDSKGKPLYPFPVLTVRQAAGAVHIYCWAGGVHDSINLARQVAAAIDTNGLALTRADTLDLDLERENTQGTVHVMLAYKPRS